MSELWSPSKQLWHELERPVRKTEAEIAPVGALKGWINNWETGKQWFLREGESVSSRDELQHRLPDSKWTALDMHPAQCQTDIEEHTYVYI